MGYGILRDVCVTLYRDRYHRSLSIYLKTLAIWRVVNIFWQGNNGSRGCFTLNHHPPSQFVFYGQGPNVPLGKANSKLFVIIPLLLSSSSLLLNNLSTCAWQAQMSPMGSGGRGNYSSQSPSLAKRATTGLQLRQQDPIAPCHKNIWPNPMQGLPGT